jgi:hypothetical protein
MVALKTVQCYAHVFGVAIAMHARACSAAVVVVVVVIVVVAR